jgi:hypothetical protein
MHSGSCHCGAVRFEVDIDLSAPLTCNCSYCRRRGSILAFTPEASFELKSGQDRLTDYRFDTMKIRHQFCATCGMEAFASAPAPDGTPMVAVNLRCLEDVDLEGFNPRQYDGRAR